MTTKYDPAKQATNKGWSLLRVATMTSHGEKRTMCLCRVGDVNSKTAQMMYATHWFNESDGGFHLGSYHADYVDARNNFTDRAVKMIQNY